MVSVLLTLVFKYQKHQHVHCHVVLDPKFTVLFQSVYLQSSMTRIDQ